MVWGLVRTLIARQRQLPLLRHNEVVTLHLFDFPFQHKLEAVAEQALKHSLKLGSVAAQQLLLCISGRAHRKRRLQIEVLVPCPSRPAAKPIRRGALVAIGEPNQRIERHKPHCEPAGIELNLQIDRVGIRRETGRHANWCAPTTSRTSPGKLNARPD